MLSCLYFSRTNMGNTQTPTTMFSCSIGDCSMKFNSQRQLTLHEEEFHGELRSQHAGSQHFSASSADVVETKIVKEGSEKGLYLNH